MKNIRVFVCGIVVGLLLTGAVFATSEQVQATFANLNIKVNRRNVKLESKPLVYNGTSYLPVRDIGELLGYNVDYDNKTKTIILSNETKSKSNDDKITTNNDKITTKKMSETFSLGDDTQIKVTNIEYSDKVGTLSSKSDETFVIVYFDIYTSANPKYDFYWYANDFATRIIVEDIELATGSTTDIMKFKPNTNSQSLVYASVPKDKKANSIVFSHPLTRDSVKVLIN